MQLEAPFTHGREHVIYLLHFEPPLKRVAHYLGIARVDMLDRRLREHGNGNGARLVRAAVNAGSAISLVRTWPNATYEQERRLKTRGHFRTFCPLCNQRLYTSKTWTILRLAVRPTNTAEWNDLTWSSACGPRDG